MLKVDTGACIHQVLEKSVACSSFYFRFSLIVQEERGMDRWMFQCMILNGFKSSSFCDKIYCISKTEEVQTGNGCISCHTFLNVMFWPLSMSKDVEEEKKNAPIYNHLLP